MSHPPVPPKSKIEPAFSVCGGQAFSFGVTTLYDWYPDDRATIACIAEVSWRTRADIWASLEDRAHEKYLFALYNQNDEGVEFWGKRMNRLEMQKAICNDNAWEWRVWGRTK